jgi:hypothetical protein
MASMIRMATITALTDTLMTVSEVAEVKMRRSLETSNRARAQAESFLIVV